MLKEEIKNIKSDKSDLRKFGLTVGIVLGLLGGLLWWRGKDIYSYFLIVSFALIFLGILLPSVLKPLQKAWMTFAIILGFFMTRVILSILFYIVITPIRLLSIMFGKEFLDLKFKEKADSYWIIKNTASNNKSSYERQF